MLLPTYWNLIPDLVRESPIVSFALGPSRPTGNPRFYKYYWRVFSLESRYEGHEFLRRAPRLCNSAFLLEKERLLGKGMSCLVYGLHRPRRDPTNPWDLSKAKWRGVAFAPSWDEDKDPMVYGGHK